MNLSHHQKEYSQMMYDPSRVPEGADILKLIIFLYICNRIAEIDPSVKGKPELLSDYFCSGLQKSGKMKTINLTQGQVALVDDEDYDFLMQWKWYATRGRRECFYAVRNRTKTNKGRGLIKMHREIMQTPNELEVDHIDHNGLNNQRYNLRNCTKKENGKNLSAWGSSIYLGVSFDRRKKVKQVRAQICVERKSISLGYYLTEEDAARAYDKGAKLYFGEFANLNFKNG
jgi:hypothetical protein